MRRSGRGGTCIFNLLNIAETERKVILTIVLFMQISASCAGRNEKDEDKRKERLRLMFLNNFQVKSAIVFVFILYCT